MRISVLGGGSWGTALASLAADEGHETTVLVREDAQAEAISLRRENPRYLPGLPLSPALRATCDPEDALRNADVCLLAVPCQHMREVLGRVAGLIPAHAVPVCASKGIEVASLKRMSEIVAELLPAQSGRYAILSGPSFAREVIEKKPTAVVLACADAPLGEKLRAALSSPRMRVYSSTDVVGVETGGAVKNVVAIAAGLCDGLELGDNARAALITRGLAEMSRLGAALGARASTFMGLSGMGDLVLTCTGGLSRNRRMGLLLSRGRSPAEAAAELGQVAEGVKTTEAVCRLAERLGIDLPIAGAVRRVLLEEAMPLALAQELMTRALREE